MEISLLFAVAFLLVPAIGVVGLVLQRRRTHALAAWAALNGWEYRSSAPELTERWRGLPFGIGSSRRATDVLSGTWQGRPATSFRYRYTDQGGEHRTTHTFHVLLLGLPAFLPTLELTPEGMGARLAKAIGGQDLQFESEDFNRAWRVTSRMPRFASDVVHPRLMERLLRPGSATNLRIEGTEILTWSAGSTDLDLIASRLGLLDAVVRSVPRFVWLEHGYDPSPPTFTPFEEQK
ncbi:hypothetical protein [Pengzhenrongella frigida]|uniref:DUF3137 domain-containing protein n=1 Tax=Pengzhenrongella frigida TaxID=1259133 RepID=A0A4Q5N5Z4_9MICO|nr:hypothetical protein [Cellulomonas sp. HLT2-17]RYV51571.1 hypothetical protein EUA98_07485 [Cellulomonas sp. HLT2-17]